MKKLYTITLENSSGELRTVEVAACDINHALQRLDIACELHESDKLKNFTTAPLPW